VTFLAPSFARPDAAWALLAPVVFLLFLRRSEQPPAVVTGTLELWRGVAASSAAAGRARRRLPAWALLCALALLLAALAGVGPRGARAPEARTWTCVVDRSPSMALALDARTTRLESALGSALGWLSRESAPGDRVRWLASGRAPLELAPIERPGPDWLAPEVQDGEPEWALHDRPGALWITDHAPPVARAQAGLFASGGDAVPGPIAADGRTTWTWDGSGLRAEPRTRACALRVVEPGGALPPVLERVLTAWCEARGFELTRSDEAEELLVVELVPASRDDELELGRDGWRARGRGALAEEDGSQEEDWLSGRTASGEALPVVRVSPGRIRLGLRELTEPTGDPALFALSFGRLLDRVARPPAGVVALAERQAAGAPLLLPPSPPSPAGAGADPGPLLDASLALGALLCALAAWLRLPRGLGVELAVRRDPHRAAPGHQ